MITKMLGERIRELRKATGLSQEKFALKIDMNRNIAICNIKKIADGLGVSLSELFEGL